MFVSFRANIFTEMGLRNKVTFMSRDQRAVSDIYVFAVSRPARIITSRPIVTILEILYMFLLVSLINSVTFLAPCDVAALYVAPLIRHKSLPGKCAPLC